MKEELYIVSTDRPFYWNESGDYYQMLFEYKKQDLSAVVDRNLKIVLDSDDAPQEVEAQMIDCLVRFVETNIGVADYILAKEYLTHERE